ncbi:helix-turn-helix domain-containing protein [Arthrobacter sp. SO3]|uniref:helix-turn-helix domain-containing protein n=1 Tax=Arthrobacter sp. SO3 TaxID=1897057 RepID=UPI001CFF60A2|nr:helix-turn-helix domain-containing protein [Arthrobacter sp. SO3]
MDQEVSELLLHLEGELVLPVLGGAYTRGWAAWFTRPPQINSLRSRYDYAMLLSIPDLAKLLGVAESRARVLVASGRIPGQRVGGRWLVDEVDAGNYRKAAAGRPLTEHNAWQFIWALPRPKGVPGLGLDAVERHRLDRRLRRFHEAADPVAFIVSLLARRADKVLLSANPEDLSALRRDGRLRLAGVSHSNSGLLSGFELEAYAARRDLPDLINDWFLLPAKPGTRPNVIIRTANVIPDEIPHLALAADLAERPGPREQQAALEIISGLRGT